MDEPQETDPPTPTAPDSAAASPLVQSGGRFADDPFWDQMQDSIRRHRREMDAEWDTAE